jgi:protein deglycase
MSKSVLVPLADGFEELEAVTIIDILRRANINVATAHLGDNEIVQGSRKTRIVADLPLGKALHYTFDMIVLPGGLPGADNLAADTRLLALIAQMHRSRHPVAAICAAPKVLAKAGILQDVRVTAYTGALDGFAVNNQHTPLEHDTHIITARGPGVALDFALHLVETLTDTTTRDTVEHALLR